MCPLSWSDQTHFLPIGNLVYDRNKYKQKIIIKCSKCKNNKEKVLWKLKGQVSKPNQKVWVGG